MKKIPVREAHSIISGCAAVVIDDDVLVYLCVSDAIKEDDAEEFLVLKWDIDGLEYETHYEEGDNQEVEICGSSMFLKNTDGGVDQLSILEPYNMEQKS